MLKRKIVLFLGALVFTTVALTGVNVAPAQAAIVSATCNYTTNDDNTVQAAINGSTNKDIIQIHGKCLFNATVKLLDNRTYEGDGKGATEITMANGSNLKALMATSTWVDNSTSTNTAITVKHLSFNGNRANNTGTPAGSAIIQFRAWNSTLEDFDIWDSPRDAVRVSNISNNGTAITNTSVNSTIKDFFIDGSGETPINVVDTENSMTDWNVLNGWIAGSGNGYNAVNLENAAGWTIQNLHIYGVSATAINADRCFSTRILGNYIEDFGTQGTANAYYSGIYCHVQGDASSVIANNTVNLFQESLGTNTTYNFIDLEGNYGTPLLSVTGNAIRGHGTTKEFGLAYNKGGATSMVVASTGNAISNVGTARIVGTGVTVSAGY